MIIAQMVGKNEAGRYLSTVLAKIRPIVDIIVFTDDRSTDDTVEIAKTYDAFVYTDNPITWEEHEGAFRQCAWRNLENHASVGDWVIVFDCDEILYGHEQLQQLTNQPNFDVIGITFYHMWNETHYRVDKAWAPTLSSRMFKYCEGGRYRMNALAPGAEPTYVQDMIRMGRFMANSPLRMQHLGYQHREDHQIKYERYMRLDQGQYHSLAHLESILDPNPTLNKWEN